MAFTRAAPRAYLSLVFVTPALDLAAAVTCEAQSCPGAIDSSSSGRDLVRRLPLQDRLAQPDVWIGGCVTRRTAFYRICHPCPRSGSCGDLRGPLPPVEKQSSGLWTRSRVSRADMAGVASPHARPVIVSRLDLPGSTPSLIWAGTSGFSTAPWRQSVAHLGARTGGTLDRATRPARHIRQADSDLALGAPSCSRHTLPSGRFGPQVQDGGAR